MARHSRIAQDVMSHFALREGKVGSAFDKKGFWRLALAKEPITRANFQAALAELVADGCLVESDRAYFLTQKGYEHIYGRGEGSTEEKENKKHQKN